MVLKSIYKHSFTHPPLQVPSLSVSAVRSHLQQSGDTSEIADERRRAERPRRRRRTTGIGAPTRHRPQGSTGIEGPTVPATL